MVSVLFMNRRSNPKNATKHDFTLFRQDEDIFQTARNINVGFFATIVLKDYVAAILNTPRANTNWWLNLGEEIKHFGNRVERGTGNVVSVEFAVLYHWHAALSDEDAKWMEKIINKAVPNKSLDEITALDFWEIEKLLNPVVKDPKQPAREWTFFGLQRGSDGRFNDADLAKIITDCIDEPAHAFGTCVWLTACRCDQSLAATEPHVQGGQSLLQPRID